MESELKDAMGPRIKEAEEANEGKLFWNSLV